MSAPAAIHPTYTGFIESTYDALIVINLCRLRQLDYVNQRVGEADRERLIRSGSVFVFDENAAGIKRWTDGLAWSPSRICNNFLVYREMPARASGRNRSRAHSEYDDDRGRTKASGPKRRMVSRGEVTSPYHGREREILGSLTDDSRFKEGGLCKRTISVGSVHLISYFVLADVVPHNRVPTPSSQRELEAFALDPALLEPEHFRVAPMVELDGSGTLRYRGEGRQVGLLSPASHACGLPSAESSPMDEYPAFDFSAIPGRPGTSTASSSGTRSSSMASPRSEVFEKTLASPHLPVPIPMPMPIGQYAAHRVSPLAHGHTTGSAPLPSAFPHRLSISSEDALATADVLTPTTEYRPRASSVSIYDSVLSGNRPPAQTAPTPLQPTFDGRPAYAPRALPYSRPDASPPMRSVVRPSPPLRQYNFGPPHALPQRPVAYDAPHSLAYAVLPSREPPRPEAYPRYVGPSFAHDFGGYSLSNGYPALSSMASTSSIQPLQFPDSPPLPTPRATAMPTGLVGAAPSSGPSRLTSLLDHVVAGQTTPPLGGSRGEPWAVPFAGVSPAPAPLYRHVRYSPSARTEWSRP